MIGQDCGFKVQFDSGPRSPILPHSQALVLAGCVFREQYP